MTEKKTPAGQDGPGRERTAVPGGTPAPAEIAQEDSARSATKPETAHHAFEAEKDHQREVSEDVNDPELVRQLIAEYKQ